MKIRNQKPGRQPGTAGAALAFPNLNKLAHRSSRALFTIVGGSVLINPAFAQDPQPAENIEEVVVTGLRASLESASW